MNPRTLLMTLGIPIILMLALFTSVPGSQMAFAETTASDTLPIVDDFEGELSQGTDSSGAAIGYVTWANTGAESVVLSTMQVAEGDAMALPDQAGDNAVLKIEADFTEWGGMTHAFQNEAADDWASQDWTSYNSFSFWIYGTGTGETHLVEIMDNRNPEMDGDTAERWEYAFANDFMGWQHFSVPFTDFSRRGDWQPDGALNDDLGLDQVSGYTLRLGAAGTYYLDGVEVTSDMDSGTDTGTDEGIDSGTDEGTGTDDGTDEGVDTDETDTDETDTGETDMGDDAPMMPSLSLVDDFEGELPLGSDSDGADIGYATWADQGSEVVVLSTMQVAEDDAMALPGQAGDNAVLQIEAGFSAWGGFTHAFENEALDSWISQDWTSYTGFNFWFYGTGTEETVFVEIFDNRNPDQEGDTAERWEYGFANDFAGWQHFSVPFSAFNRRGDFQPGGALDDGLGLDQVSGYALRLSVPGTYYFDHVTLTSPLNDDFEGEFPYGMNTWGAGPVPALEAVALMADSPDAVPGQMAENTALKVDYELIDWGGGFTQEMFYEQGMSSDWSNFQGFSFWMKGGATGQDFAVELFDNRNPDSVDNEDTAERHEYFFTDVYSTWHHINIPFSAFTHRTDWQPDGSPNDGMLGLNEVWGYAMRLPGASGTLHFDDVKLVKGYTPVSDFEADLGADELLLWGDYDSGTTVEAARIAEMIPGSGEGNNVLNVTYDLAGWGGGISRNFVGAAQDWRGNEGFSFWFKGDGSGHRVRVELKNNGEHAEAAELWVTHFNADFTGWRHMSFPFNTFTRRTDFQPGEAPNDGVLNLDEMWGYAFGPEAIGPGSFALDNVAAYGATGSMSDGPGGGEIMINFAKMNYMGNEGDDVSIELTLSMTPTDQVIVDYVTPIGTGPVVFEPGMMSQMFTVQIPTDDEGEIAEHLMLMLENPVGAMIGEHGKAKLIVNAHDLPYLDTELSTEERVADLLDRMTWFEKFGQMTQIQHLSLASSPEVIAEFALGSLLSGGGGAPLEGNMPEDWANMVDRYQMQARATRLQIPLIYGVDAVHGHSNVYGTTIFPHNIGLGATRNPELARIIGRVTAVESAATGMDWTFSPCLCVARDDRWGRTYESFGEHPEIAAMMTTIIEGYQGQSLADPETVLATAKHWVGDGGTTDGIDQGETTLSEEELRAVHIAPFVDAIAKDVGSIMPSYSSWNGDKLHGQGYLINEVLRDEMGFDGFIISDWQAIDQIPGDYASDVRNSINAGVDMVMVPYDWETFINTLMQEYSRNNVSGERIDEAVSRILTAKFELGLFESPFANRELMDRIGVPDHRAVARQAVRESLVLLKNEEGALPIAKDAAKILVAGKNANDLGNQMGGWSITWQGESGETTIGTTILQGIEQAVSADTVVDFDQNAEGELTGYDMGIVVIGETPYAEFQGYSEDLALTAEDAATVATVCDAMPCVVILVSGRPLIINDELEAAEAFIAAWLPGSEGNGVADVIFGDQDFSGTLPISWPRSVEQQPINVGDADYDPLFAYGFGLDMGGVPRVSFSSNVYPAMEGGEVIVTLQLNKAAEADVSVDYNYGEETGTVTFAAGETEQSFALQIPDDEEIEEDEVTQIMLANPTGVTIAGVGGAGIIIRDNEVSIPDPVTTVVDFEGMEELPSGQDSFNNGIGFVPWQDGGGELALSIATIGADDPMALEGQEGPNNALKFDHNINQWGGFTHAFTNEAGTDWVSQDWRSYEGVYFWFNGNNSGEMIQFEVFDNRGAGSTNDSAERWFYRFADDQDGWKFVNVPFAMLQRRTDFQPGGAPDDGLTLGEVWGYAMGFPPGENTSYIDNVILYGEVEVPPGPPKLGFASGTFEVTEANTAIIKVVLSDPAKTEVRVTYSVKAGSATPERDYMPMEDGTLVFGPGVTEKFIFIDTMEDTKYEGDETIRLTLSDPEGAGLGSMRNAVVKIVDNDSQDKFIIEDFDLMGAGLSASEGIITSQTEIEAGDTLALPGQGPYERVVTVNYATGDNVGSVGQRFAEPQDWSEGNGISFLYYGSNNGLTMTVELLNNESSEAAVPANWTLAWSDEFDDPAGTAPHAGTWTHEIGDGTANGIAGWGNNELEYYTDSTDNAATDGEGNLVITVLETPEIEGASSDQAAMDCYYGPCRYTSARLITQDKLEIKHGRVEARIRVPSGQGIWPAFWMLGSDFDTVGWPDSGEIDIMENIGREPNIVHGTLHGPGYSGGSGVSGSYTLAQGNLADDFHTYAIEWEKNEIRWYMDGEQYHRATPDDIPADTAWPFEQPFFLLLNVAVGGNWAGAPDETSTYPQTMHVDYVRVYQGPSSAEQFEAPFVDNTEGWQRVTLPYTDFVRSVNQPAGAPDDGFDPAVINGYNIVIPAGANGLFHMDQLSLAGPNSLQIPTALLPNEEPVQNDDWGRIYLPLIVAE